jgi:hypothetical protein
MTTIERDMPDGLEPRVNIFYENFQGYMDKKELQMESDLIGLFKQVGIHAATKTDRKSLDHHESIEKTLILESWIPGWFEHERTFRDIVKGLLEKDITKVRFYVHIEPVKLDRTFFLMPLYGMKYSFRYYTHR